MCATMGIISKKAPADYPDGFYEHCDLCNKYKSEERLVSTKHFKNLQYHRSLQESGEREV